MARVNDESQSYLPPTRLSTNGISHILPLLPAAEHHRILTATQFPSHRR